MKLLLLVSFLYLADARTFRFTNNLNEVIWVGTQGNQNVQLKGGKSFPPLNNGGFVLNPHQTVDVQSSDDWEGRFWGRTGCSSSTKHCVTGDCGNRLQCEGAGGQPPVTLVEITLQGYGGKDYYDVSLVDGFNLQMAITPLGGHGDGSQYSCRRCACDRNLNNDCPSALQERIAGQVVACKSACEAFNTDQYCCRGAHNTPQTCKSTDWKDNYPKFFKDRCPDAYSYAYDDHKSTFTCNAPMYLITFG